MERRTLLLVGIVGAAAAVAGWRNLAPQPSTPPYAAQASSGAVREALPVPSGAPAAQASPARIVVYVAGEVRKPGVYTLPASARAEAALAAAGGAGPTADLVAVNLAERLSDGEAFVVPPKGAAAEPRARGSGGHARRSHRGGRSTARSHKALPAAPIDLNAAGAAELERLPGIGASLAERIVAFREVNGRFARLDDLLDVAGMNERKLDALAAYVSLR